MPICRRSRITAGALALAAMLGSTGIDGRARWGPPLPAVHASADGEPVTVSGRKARAALDAGREALLDELEAASAHPVDIVADRPTGTVLFLGLDYPAAKLGADPVARAREFLRRYQPLLDPRIDAAEYVPGESITGCGDEVVTLERWLGGRPVVGSRITLHFSAQQRLERVVNGVAPVPARFVSIDPLSGGGRPLGDLLPQDVPADALPRVDVVAPTPDGSGVHEAQVVVWSDPVLGMRAAPVAGDVALTAPWNTTGDEPTARPADAPVHHLDPLTQMPDFIDYRGVGGVRVNGLPAERNPAEMAYRFLEEHPTLFRTGAARCQYRVKSLDEAPSLPGVHLVRFEQRFMDLPVLGAELVIQVEDGSTVMAAWGRALPTIEVDPRPRLTPDRAEEIARAQLRAAVTGEAEDEQVEAALGVPAVTRLVILPMSLVRSEAQKERARLAYEVRHDHVVAFVDAHHGELVRSLSTRSHDDLVIHDAGGASELGRPFYVREEADGVPTGLIAPNIDIGGPAGASAAIAATAGAFGALGQRGVDGRGGPFVLNTNVSLLAGCSNAFFDPIVTGEAFACLGIAHNDVVAHEFTHGVVFTSSGLIPWDESGAIAEAYGDLMGNLMFPDPTWLVGESTTDAFGAATGAFRNMANPAAFGHPATMAAYRRRDATCNVLPFSCDFGFVHSNNGIVNRAHVLLTDGIPGLTTGIGRDKMLRLGFLTMRSLTPLTHMADLPRVTRNVCDTLVARGGTGLDLTSSPPARRPFTRSDCDQIPAAFHQVGLGSALSSGWSEGGFGFAGRDVLMAGEATPTGCAVANVTGVLASPSGDLPVDLSPATLVPTVASFFPGYSISMVVPPGSPPPPIGTTAMAHAIDWVNVFGGPLGGRPRFRTNVDVAPPPPGAADCRTPAGLLPVPRSSNVIVRSAPFGASGTDAPGNPRSTMDSRCTLVSTVVELVDGGGSVIGVPGAAASHTVNVDILFIHLRFTRTATLLRPPLDGPPGAATRDLSAPVAWSFPIFMDARFRLAYTIGQPSGVTCTP